MVVVVVTVMSAMAMAASPASTSTWHCRIRREMAAKQSASVSKREKHTVSESSKNQKNVAPCNVSRTKPRLKTLVPRHTRTQNETAILTTPLPRG